MGLIVAIAMCVFIAKVADFEDRSPVLWGLLTFGLIIACALLIRIAFVNTLVAGVLAFGMLMIARMRENR